jgi:hypothetical protein
MAVLPKTHRAANGSANMGTARAAVDYCYVVEDVRGSDRGAAKPRAGYHAARQGRNSLFIFEMTGATVLSE